MEEHLQPELKPAHRKKRNRYLTEQDLIVAHFNAELLERPKMKTADKAKLLVLVSLWLQEALAACPEINTITTSNLKVADELVSLVKTVPDDFVEQQTYLLQYQEQLKDTGKDPKWLRTPGSQAEFVARSMAGAKWGVPPSSSREYIRQINRKRKATNRGVVVQAGLTDELVKEGSWWCQGALDED